MSKKVKLIFIAVLVVIVFLVIIGTLGANKDRIQGYFENKRAQATYDQMLAEKNALEERKKNDFAGGKTPEETIGMFLEALKKGDVEKANSYFIPDSKNSGWVESNNIEVTLVNLGDVVTMGEKSCTASTHQCTFSIKRDDGKYVLLLEQNPQIGIWKIVY